MSQRDHTSTTKILALAAIAAVIAALMLWRPAADPAGPDDDAIARARPSGITRVEPATEVDASPPIGPRGAARASIAGTIRDQEGSPIVGAQVCAVAVSPLLGSADVDAIPCARSEADGRYHLDELFPVRHRVLASAPGRRPATLRGGPGGRRDGVQLAPGADLTGVDLVLRGGGVELRGVVMDLGGGPIADAQIFSDGAFARSDDEGAFSLWVNPGTRWVTAAAEGYAAGSETGSAPGHQFKLYLTPEAVLVGAVLRDGDGAPIEGARVSTSRRGADDAVAFTDGAGRFRLTGLPPGVYKPEAVTDDAWGLADEQVVLGIGETSPPQVIRAGPALRIAGSAVIAGADACEGGRVSLEWLEDFRGAPIAGDGEVVFRGLQPGTYRVHVACSGAVEADLPPIELVDRSLEGLRWEVEAGHAIRGRVVDERGAPAPAVVVRAAPKVDPRRPAGPTSYGGGETTDDGAFEIAGLLAGAYTITVEPREPPRAAAAAIEVTLPEGQDVDGVSIALPGGGDLRGQVVDASAQPVTHVSVTLSAGPHFYSASVADDGSFAFEHVDAGAYQLVARRGMGEALPGRRGDLEGERVVVRAGQTARHTLVVAATDGVIRGVVQDEGGSPIADAFVEAMWEPERADAAGGSATREGRWGSLFGGPPPVLSDSEGAFTLTGLIAGKHSVRAHRRGGGEAIVEHVATGDSTILTITPTARLSGVVTLAGGGAPPDFWIEAVDEATGFTRVDRVVGRGTFALPEIPAGTYTIRVTAAAGAAERTQVVGAGEEVAGITIELTPRVTVRGRVVDDAGEAIAGVLVRVRDRGFTWSSAANTDADGRYEVTDAPAGSVFVVLTPNGSGHLETEAPALLLAAAPEVELPPIELARRRVDAGEAVGDLGYTVHEPEPAADPAVRRLIVASVRVDGPAAASGLAVGDEIVAVDGHDVRGPRSYLYPGLVQAPVGASITLGLARGASAASRVGEPP